MVLPLITEIDRYKKLISYDYCVNVMVLLIPYTYSDIPRGTDIYYMTFTTHSLRTFTAEGPKIRLGIEHSGTSLTGRIYRNQRELCRYL